MTAATVLLIEEHEPLRLLYEQALEDEGYIVLAARDSRDALRRVSETPPDLIVLEPTSQKCPLETWSILMQVAGHPPVIWNTGRPDYREKAQAFGAAFVLKSSDLNELCEQVRLALIKTSAFSCAA
jgi:DNA-binding NtrC family response regulator